jgi:hypothetical protein
MWVDERGDNHGFSAGDSSDRLLGKTNRHHYSSEVIGGGAAGRTTRSAYLNEVTASLTDPFSGLLGNQSNISS